ncbi:MAG: EamA family transporter, partial [Chitinophagaceae bacterium]|nr:EamA family transporter [Chitinophagaceae bacterium]
MSSTNNFSNEITAIGLALLAVIIWGGNFVIARSVVGQIGPISLGFFRWLIASLIMLPIAWKTCKREWKSIFQNLTYLSITALFGITLFNTLVYVAGHYTGAINMAMIGTTSSPIFSIILAYLILKEKPGLLRIAGIIICISGILWLLAGGNWQQLLSSHLSTGDIWVLGGAFCFAVYNIQVRRKPPTLSSTSFLLVVFTIGTIFLFPAMIWEVKHSDPIQWSSSMFSMLL